MQFQYEGDPLPGFPRPHGLPVVATRAEIQEATAMATANGFRPVADALLANLALVRWERAVPGSTIHRIHKPYGESQPRKSKAQHNGKAAR